MLGFGDFASKARLGSSQSPSLRSSRSQSSGPRSQSSSSNAISADTRHGSLALRGHHRSSLRGSGTRSLRIRSLSPPSSSTNSSSTDANDNNILTRLMRVVDPIAMDNWSYSPVSPHGPDRWTRIPDVHVNPHLQSPIIFSDDSLRVHRSRFTPDMHYTGHSDASTSPSASTTSACVCTVRNTGRTIEIAVPNGESGNVDGGYVIFAARKYHLRQIHFHSPSEHKFPNRHFEMEAHMVHTTDTGETLVIALFLNPATSDGKGSGIFRELVSLTPRSATSPPRFARVPLGEISAHVRASEHFHVYVGSLTTPPLLEGVVWIVVEEEVGVEREFLRQVKAAMPWHNRRRVVGASNDRVSALSDVCDS